MNKSEHKHKNISHHINKVLEMHRDQAATNSKLVNEYISLKQDDI